MNVGDIVLLLGLLFFLKLFKKNLYKNVGKSAFLTEDREVDTNNLHR